MSEFGRLLEQQIPLLHRYARALTRDRSLAEDLVQSCLARALDKQQLWQPGTDIKAWLATLLHNLHVTDVRRSVRAASVSLATASQLGVPSRSEAHLELRDLDRAIGSLPEEQRQALLLIGLEGMRYDEAAAILAVPTGTLRSRLSRARASLRGHLSRPATFRRGYRLAETSPRQQEIVE